MKLVRWEEFEEEESVAERYAKMAKHDKLALLMIALGPDAASTLLKRFDAKDAENICKRIGDFPIVEQELKDCVLDEFSEIIESSVNSNLGGMNFAQKTLEMAHGSLKANNIMNRIAPVRDSLDFMDDIKEMDSGQIYNVLRFEQPQTIAFVLANVDPDKASEVLQLMPPNVQEQVIERVGSMETTPMDQIEVVATNPLVQESAKKGNLRKSRQVELNRRQICSIGLIKKKAKNCLKALKSEIQSWVVQLGKECFVLKIWSGSVQEMLPRLQRKSIKMTLSSHLKMHPLS